MKAKSGSAFAFIFGMNWPVQLVSRNDNFHGMHDMHKYTVLTYLMQSFMYKKNINFIEFNVCLLPKVYNVSWKFFFFNLEFFFERHRFFQWLVQEVFETAKFCMSRTISHMQIFHDIHSWSKWWNSLNFQVVRISKLCICPLNLLIGFNLLEIVSYTFKLHYLSLVRLRINP